MAYRVVGSRRTSQDSEDRNQHRYMLRSSEIAEPGGKLAFMEVHLKPESESRLQELAALSGRSPDQLIEDAMAGYLRELAQTREMLDGRYDDIKSGRVKAVDGRAFFDSLRQREEELLKQRSSK